MKIKVVRHTFTDKSTIGDLFIDDKWECYTLEDKVRENPVQSVDEWKIKGETAIPVGIYELIVDRSHRFQRQLPHILGVPGFTGVRVHAGNNDKNTEGCVLLGQNMKKNWIGKSRLAFDSFFEKLLEALAENKKVTLEIT